MMVSHASIYEIGSIHFSEIQPAGDYKCEYKIDFFPIETFERLVGEWHINIFAGDITFFDDVGYFDYTGANEPDDIYIETVRIIPLSWIPRIITVHWVWYDQYIGGEYFHSWSVKDFLQDEIFFPRHLYVIKNMNINYQLLQLLKHLPIIERFFIN